MVHSSLQYWLPRSHLRQIVVASWHHWQMKPRQSSDIYIMAAEKLDGCGGACQHPHRLVAAALGGMPRSCWTWGLPLGGASPLRRGYDLIDNSSDFLSDGCLCDDQGRTGLTGGGDDFAIRATPRSRSTGDHLALTGPFSGRGQHLSGHFLLAPGSRGCIRLLCGIRCVPLLVRRRHLLPRGNQVRRIGRKVAARQHGLTFARDGSIRPSCIFRHGRWGDELHRAQSLMIHQLSQVAVADTQSYGSRMKGTSGNPLCPRITQLVQKSPLHRGRRMASTGVPNRARTISRQTIQQRRGEASMVTGGIDRGLPTLLDGVMVPDSATTGATTTFPCNFGWSP